MTAQSKAALRCELRSARGDEKARAVESAAICRWILASEAYRNASVIAGYAPLAHEADVTPVLRDALRQGKTVVMPLCSTAPEMTLRRIDALEDMRRGMYGIPEPSSDAQEIAPAQVDLILVPLEGIDREGYRLGKGGGYYDCLLQRTGAYTIGCALSWQRVESVPRDAWDKPLSACADANGLREFVR